MREGTGACARQQAEALPVLGPASACGPLVEHLAWSPRTIGGQPEAGRGGRGRLGLSLSSSASDC